jgi:hypothetical protein
MKDTENRKDNEKDQRRSNQEKNEKMIGCTYKEKVNGIA